MNVNVPPARATPDRFKGFKIFLLSLLLALAGLGIWKLYELVTLALVWYDTNRALVWATLTLVCLALIILGVYLFLRGRRQAKMRKATYRTEAPLATADDRTAALHATAPSPVDEPVFRVEPLEEQR